MRLRKKGELRIVDEIRRRFPSNGKGVVLGIGDDAAVIKPGRKNQVATTDLMAEGVHFKLSYTKPAHLGFKLISTNVSDVYAMAGKPLYALLNLALRPDMDEKFLKELLRGVSLACKKYGVSLIGGDLSSVKGISPIFLSATIIGEAERPVMRSGARPGDFIYATGALGDSAMGLMLLKRPALKKKVPPKIAEKLIKRHLMPEPDMPSPAIAKNASAMMDISDGLIIDLTRLCKESGVGAVVYEEAVPISDELRTASKYLKADALSFALSGGEDYCLLFTAPNKIKIKAYKIGEITESGGVMTQDAGGRTRRPSVRGYAHFEH